MIIALLYLIVGMAGISFFTWRFAQSWNRVEHEPSTSVVALVVNALVVTLFVVGSTMLIYMQWGQQIANVALSCNFLTLVAVFSLVFVIRRSRQTREKDKWGDEQQKAKRSPRFILGKTKRKQKDRE
jgi:hypothetical protein